MPLPRHILPRPRNPPPRAPEVDEVLGRREDPEDDQGGVDEDGLVEAGWEVGVERVPRQVQVPQRAGAERVQDRGLSGVWHDRRIR